MPVGLQLAFLKSRDGSPAVFLPESAYSVLPISQRLTLKYARTAARRAKPGHHMRGSRLYFQHSTSGANQINLAKTERSSDNDKPLGMKAKWD